MSVSLHTVVIGTYQQILPRIAGLVTKAEEHCKASGLDGTALTEQRLAPDMWPFAKQVFECGHHSSRAIEGVRKGEFSPERDPVASDFASLHKELTDAMAIIDGVKPDELDAIAERDMKFVLGERSMPFTVADFLLTFSLPNFYFHATTAYDILRNQGLPIGKMDFLGQLRLKK